jgi:hypothetical protein
MDLYNNCVPSVSPFPSVVGKEHSKRSKRHFSSSSHSFWLWLWLFCTEFTRGNFNWNDWFQNRDRYSWLRWIRRRGSWLRARGSLYGQNQGQIDRTSRFTSSIARLQYHSDVKYEFRKWFSSDRIGILPHRLRCWSRSISLKSASHSIDDWLQIYARYYSCNCWSISLNHINWISTTWVWVWV